MDVRLFLRLAFCSTLVIGAGSCCDESFPQRPVRGDSDSNDDSNDDDDDDEGSNDDEDDESTDRPASRRDAGADASAPRDAGRDARADATAATPDAGRDAGDRDATTPRGPTVIDPADEPLEPADEPVDPPDDTTQPAPTQPPPDESGGGGTLNACAEAVTAGQAVFGSVCRDCHSAGRLAIDPNNLGARAGLIPDRISRPAGATGAMPPSGPLPAAQLQAITDWLNCL